MAADTRTPAVIDVFLAFLRLGLTSFGGPVAHIGYFRAEFVERRRWLEEQAFADLVGLCQFLPGPASSQVGIALGLRRAGYAGALAAWAGFTLPSAALLILFALGLAQLGPLPGGGALQGLRVVAVAVVAQALWQMGRQLCPDRTRAAMAVAAALTCLLLPSASGQALAILGGALLGRLLLRQESPLPPAGLVAGPGWQAGMVALVLFLALLILLPLVAAASHAHWLALLAGFYRAGALVFGGGHVVLPLLQAGVVGPGWVSDDAFLAGYGAAQAVPGPLFSFAAYLGAADRLAPAGWAGGLLCLVAIYLPSFLLLSAALPFWERLRQLHGARRAMAGVNASVVGLLLAAFYQPVWTSAILKPADFGLALAAFLLLALWKLPPWLVVLCCALAGALLL